MQVDKDTILTKEVLAEIIKDKGYEDIEIQGIPSGLAFKTKKRFLQNSLGYEYHLIAYKLGRKLFAEPPNSPKYYVPVISFDGEDSQQEETKRAKRLSEIYNK